MDPTSQLKGLPVELVNQDQGTTSDGQHMVLGQDIVAGLTRTPAVTRPLSLRITSLAEAQAEMDDGVAYAAIVVHPTFSASVLAVLGGPLPAGTPPQASVELLSNPRLGCDSKNPDGPASPSGAGRGSGSRPG